jgi:hypothetical protein
MTKMPKLIGSGFKVQRLIKTANRRISNIKAQNFEDWFRFCSAVACAACRSVFYKFDRIQLTFEPLAQTWHVRIW